MMQQIRHSAKETSHLEGTSIEITQKANQDIKRWKIRKNLNDMEK